MERIFCLAIGYAFGLFQTGYLYGKMNHIDIRNYGSGNSGATNALRVLGKKAGAIVFFGDFFKCVFACLLARLIFRESADQDLYVLYTGVGVMLGHNFPCYLKFKGGKGIASLAGLLCSTDWRITVVCAALFLGIVIVTRFVSLGSICVAVMFFILTVSFGLRGDFTVTPQRQIEFFAVAGFIAAMAVWRHKANIRRLLNGTENKLWGGKKQ